MDGTHQPHWNSPLEPGAKVALIAPSSWFDPQRFAQGLAVLSAWGLTPVFDEAVLARQTRYLAGSADERVAEIVRALRDPAIRALWAIRGGYGCTQLLTRISPRTIAAAGKPLLGFSDIVALHALWYKAGVGSVHGHNVTTLGGASPDAIAPLRAFLFQGTRGVVMRGTGGAGPTARGPLVGGNLALVAALCGTAHQFPTRGAILFLEDVGERPYRLDRMLTQLEQSGILRGISGVLLGDFSGCDPLPADGAGYSGAQVAIDFFCARGLPVVWGLPFGHGDRLTPLFYGDLLELDPGQAEVHTASP